MIPKWKQCIYLESKPFPDTDMIGGGEEATRIDYLYWCHNPNVKDGEGDCVENDGCPYLKTKGRRSFRRRR